MVSDLSTLRGGEAVHHRKWREVLDDLMVHADTTLEPVLAYGWGNVPGYGDVAGVKPHQHWQVALTRMDTPEDAPRGRLTRVGWMLETLAVAPSEDEVRVMRDRLHTIRDRRAPFLHASPLRLYGENNIDRLPGAAGDWGGLSTWTYVTPR